MSSYSMNPTQFFANKQSLCHLTSSEWETLEILFEVDQFQMLITSLEEARLGQIIPFNEAFGDLDQ